MKTIASPEPVTAGDGTTVALADFVRHALLVDQRFNASGAGIRAAARIETALGSEPIALEETDYELLSEAVERPQPMPNMPAYPLRPARLCAPLLEAIKGAR